MLLLSILERDPPLLLSWRFRPFSPLKGFFLFLGNFSWSDVRSWDRGCHMFTDCKALWAKFVICDNGLHKINIETELNCRVQVLWSRVLSERGRATYPHLQRSAPAPTMLRQHEYLCHTQNNNRSGVSHETNKSALASGNEKAASTYVVFSPVLANNYVNYIKFVQVGCKWIIAWNKRTKHSKSFNGEQTLLMVLSLEKEWEAVLWFSKHSCMSFLIRLKYRTPYPKGFTERTKLLIKKAAVELLFFQALLFVDTAGWPPCSTWTLFKWKCT